MKKMIDSLLWAASFVILLIMILYPDFSNAQLRIYEIDRFGNVQYGESSLEIQKDGSVVKVDRFGNRKTSEEGFLIKNKKIYHTDRFGNTRESNILSKTQTKGALR